MSVATPDGEFRVPEDVEAERAAAAPPTDGHGDPDAAPAEPTDPTGPTDTRRRRRRAARADRPAPDLTAVDLDGTPGTVVGAVALGVVAAPLLGVYAVLFLTRAFLRPGVSPDLTGSWTGEGVCGGIAAVLALVMVVVVARAAGGRGLPVFVGAQVLVVATCGYLLSDSASGGRGVTVSVLVASVAAIALALVPVSRVWFAAHAAERGRRG